MKIVPSGFLPRACQPQIDALLHLPIVGSPSALTSTRSVLLRNRQLPITWVV
jgi:hypothetical protein